MLIWILIFLLNLILLYNFISILWYFYRYFEWDIPKNMEPNKLAFKSSGHTLHQLEDVGLQLALAFSSDGTSLAIGGEVYYLNNNCFITHRYGKLKKGTIMILILYYCDNAQVLSVAYCWNYFCKLLIAIYNVSFIT